MICGHRDGSLGPRHVRLVDPRRRTPPKTAVIEGAFTPPTGTLLLGVGRQPNGFTCGSSTFLSICDFLRLPVRDPDDDDIESLDKVLLTNYRTGTDPDDIAKVARKHLEIEADVRPLEVDELADIVDDSQRFVAELLSGGKPRAELRIVMVSYQAYVDPDHERSFLFPKGRSEAEEAPPEDKSIRRPDWSVIWKDDWSDGHWSAVTRVVMPREKEVIASMRAQLGAGPRVDEIKKGVVILGDPSNGEGLSFSPIPEFNQRWHDTDRNDKPLAQHPSVVLTVSVPRLVGMQQWAKKGNVPMFSTVARNSVIYVP
jgi:hypothetical protein